jgi:hypothetical protein
MKNIKDYLFKSKKTFAKGLSKEKMFFVFIIFSFLGCLYEDTLSIVINYLNTLPKEDYYTLNYLPYMDGELVL